MGKLLDNLRKKHAATQPKARRHTVNFLAHKDEITEALRGGWTSKQIWDQMVEDGMTTMSYSTFCRHVEKHILSGANSANGAIPPADTSSLPLSPSRKSQTNSSTKKAKSPKRELTEKERLDLLKDEAFKPIRSGKSSGPLIGKPKTRDEENEELFG